MSKEEDLLDIVSESSPGVPSRAEMRRRWGIKVWFSWIEGLKEELQKVSWTTPEELRLSTKVVVISIFAFGFGIYVMDFVIKGALDGVASLVRIAFG